MKHHGRQRLLLFLLCCFLFLECCDFFSKVVPDGLSPIEAELPETTQSNQNENTQDQKPTVKETKEPDMIYVHIAGEVQNPGIYKLREGSRLYEAIELAGGFTQNAAQNSVNLARILSDGEQVVVYEEGQYVEEKPQAGSPGQSAKVNINTATLAEFMTLPGIGQAKAEAIIAYRKANGSFSTIEDIMKVPGIKEAAFLKIRDYIVVR